MADHDADRNPPEQEHLWDVAVIGLGYVGLNLALSACQAGLRVVGIDRDPALVAELTRGRTVVDGVDDADIDTALRRGFRATMDTSAVSDAATVVIAVQTPLTVDGRPDHGAVIAAAGDIAPHLRHGALVSLESTVAIGTTDGPVREVLEQGGRSAGRDFSLVFAPERINPGDAASTVADVPRVVGGIDDISTMRGVSFYQRFVKEVYPVVSTREAELAKLLENTYRYINVTLINELASSLAATDIDVHAAIQAAGTKPYGFQPFLPGPGVGGHCIPVDPMFLQSSLEDLGNGPSGVLAAAYRANIDMPSVVTNQVLSALVAAALPVAGARIGLIGVGYKEGVRDTRNSPAFPIASELLDAGANVSFFDDLVHVAVADGNSLYRHASVADLVASCDVVVRLQTSSADSFDLHGSAPLLVDLRPGQGLFAPLQRPSEVFVI